MSHYEPPHDLGAERTVLGAMLSHRQAAARGIELLAAGDFYRSTHAAIFEAIARGVLLREPTDPAAIAIRLGPLLARVGGAPYLFELLSDTPVTGNLSWYADVVADRAKMRRLIEAGSRIIQIGHDTQREPSEAAALALKYLTDAAEGRSRRTRSAGRRSSARMGSPKLARVRAGLAKPTRVWVSP